MRFVMDRVSRIRLKYELLKAMMDERMTRLWAASEALALGRGGVSAVTEATGILHKRIIAGKRDLEELQEAPPVREAGEQRVRRPGGGRKPVEYHHPDVVQALERLISPATRGDPESPLRWTTKSTRKLAAELKELGYQIWPSKGRALLKDLG